MSHGPKAYSHLVLFSVLLKEESKRSGSSVQAVLEALRRATEAFGDEAVAQLIIQVFTDEEITEEIKAVLRRRSIEKTLAA